MKYTKSQLNAIGRYYTELYRKQREQKLEKFKKSNPEEYALFEKSKYKTLNWYEKFMKKVPNFEDRKTIIEKYALKNI